MTARFVVGDALTVMRAMPEGSVDLVLTSPPFLALRSYLPADHPDKASEIGSEATPGEYLDVLLDVVVECRRVLAPHGSLVIELGDTYAGSGGAGGDYAENGLRDGQERFDGSARRGRGRAGGESGQPSIPGRKHYTIDKAGIAWPLDKSLTGIPELFMLSLTYGRNLLTGREIEPWRVRNFCPWVRPNPPVGALGDKFRPATSYLTVACTGRDRWFDLDAVRTLSQDTRPRNTNGPKNAEADDVDVLGHYDTRTTNPAGAPPLDWFAIPTAPYKGAHYATYPPDLVVPFVKSMCPQRVCRVCGEPSRRIVEKTDEYAAARKAVTDYRNDGGKGSDYDQGRGVTGTSLNAVMNGAAVPDNRYETLGWTDCGCGDGFGDEDTRWRPGVVLDPFCGSGTTLAVATGHGRDAIGIDLDERNADLARERVGMFLEVDYEERVA